jgi:hypothetical protein
MLYRINMNVIHMRAQIGLVAYEVLPEPTLPDAAFSAVAAHLGAPFVTRQ